MRRMLSHPAEIDKGLFEPRSQAMAENLSSTCTST